MTLNRPHFHLPTPKFYDKGVVATAIRVSNLSEPSVKFTAEKSKSTSNLTRASIPRPQLPSQQQADHLEKSFKMARRPARCYRYCKNKVREAHLRR